MKELMDSLATNFDIDEMPGAEQAPNNPLETETYTEIDDEIDDDSKTDDDGTEDESDKLEYVDGNEPSASEKAGMLKKKVTHRFRTERHLTEATAEGRPIAGFIEHLSAVDSQKKSQTRSVFKAVFWGKQNAFFTQEILFNDRKGISKNGIWSAPIAIGARERVSEWRLVQSRARQGAVAIPNAHFTGDENTHSRKCSVTTNWWKWQMASGEHKLLCLDRTLCGC